METYNTIVDVSHVEMSLSPWDWKINSFWQ